MRLTGIEIRNFRSIGAEGVVLNPWRKCNILVGQNNSGKSNVIAALTMIANLHGGHGGPKLSNLDLHQRDSKSKFSYSLRFHVESNDPKEAQDIASALDADEVHFDFSVEAPESISYDSWSGTDVTDFNKANDLFSAVRNQRWNSRIPPDAMRKALNDMAPGAFNRFAPAIPMIHTIPEFRQIRPGDSYTFDGQNLVALLSKYRTPPIGQDELRQNFERIQDFVRDLLHLPEAALEITEEYDLLINDRGLRLPVSSYGTGTHELVIILTAVLHNEGDLYCIEEPEIHMHPRLQREFLNFITSNTGNTYLISTHSHVFINALDWIDDVQIFHLRAQSGSTFGSPILEDRESLQALNDLGVAPSDVLQANCTLWVEGPSDKIYIQRWLNLLAPDLVEGKDFSIMFYGGRLLSHLGFNREKIPEELIRILRIAQNSIVVMDSDRSGPGGRLNRTKERVKKESEDSGGYCWVTDGREIENLLPVEAVVRAVKDHSEIDVKLKIEKYAPFPDQLDKAIVAAGGEELHYERNKVRFSGLFSENMAASDLSSNLSKTLKEVVSKIRFWNE